MNRTHPLARGRSWLLRASAALAFVAFAAVGYAQTALDNLVAQAEAIQRTEAHFAVVNATFETLSEKDAGYAYQARRHAFAMHVLEDMIVGSEPRTAIIDRAILAYEAPSAASGGQGGQTGGALEADIRQTVVSGGTSSPIGTRASSSVPVDLSDPIVAELVTLLTR